MLTDHWVIAQLLALFCLTVLFVVISGVSVQLLRGWQKDTWDEDQTKLERKSFLVSSISQVGFWLQLFLLVFFLFTVNTHLPPVIKGAMCASGVLYAQVLGVPLLWIKLVVFLFFIIFGIVNSLDLEEKMLPLSPSKYWLVFPLSLLLLTDLGMTFSYFRGLSPDVISTCCSVDFLVRKPHNGFDFVGVCQSWYPWVLYSLLVVFILLQLIKNNWCIYFSLVIGIGIVLFQWLVLKNDQVAYIYGVPDHHCLYDTFLGRYHYIGFVFLMGSILFLYVQLLAVTRAVISNWVVLEVTGFGNDKKWLGYFGLVLLVFIPLLYQVFSGFHF